MAGRRPQHCDEGSHFMLRLIFVHSYSWTGVDGCVVGTFRKKQGKGAHHRSGYGAPSAFKWLKKDWGQSPTAVRSSDINSHDHRYLCTLVNTVMSINTMDDVLSRQSLRETYPGYRTGMSTCTNVWCCSRTPAYHLWGLPPGGRIVLLLRVFLPLLVLTCVSR